MTEEEMITIHNEMIARIITKCDYYIKNYPHVIMPLEEFYVEIKNTAKFYVIPPKWYNAKGETSHLTHTEEENVEGYSGLAKQIEQD